MKKFLLIIIAMICGVLQVLAAANYDLIIKTNSEKIEALIQEVSETELRYKKVGNPNGPVYVVKISEISTIIYANGEVEVMDQKSASQPSSQAQTASQGSSRVMDVLAQMEVQKQAEPTSSATTASSRPVVIFPEHQMRKEGNIYYLGKKPMTRDEMLQFMQENCDKAYKQYLKNRKLERAGWALFGVGPGIAVGGGILNYWVSKSRREPHPVYTTDSYDMLNALSFAMAGVGGGIFVASIPMICVGAVRKNNVHKAYNIWCAEEDNPTSALFEFNLTSGVNGFGVAMNF